MEWFVLIICGTALVIYKCYEANEKAADDAVAINKEKQYQLLHLVYEVLSNFNMRHKHFTISSLESFAENGRINRGNGKPPCYVFRLPLGYCVLATDISKDLKRHLQGMIDSKICDFPLLDNRNSKYSVYLADIVVAPTEVRFKVYINDNLQVAQRIQSDLRQEGQRKRY